MNKSRFFLYALIAIPIGLLIVPTVIVLGVALIPTGVAFLMERGKGYYAGVTVGSLNLAGASPYLFDLWFKGHTVPAAIAIITNVFAWMMFYGAAMFGWAIYSTTPSLVSTFMTMTSGRRITALRAQQRELVQKYYFQEYDRLPQYCTEEVLRTAATTTRRVGKPRPLRCRCCRDFRRSWLPTAAVDWC